MENPNEKISFFLLIIVFLSTSACSTISENDSKKHSSLNSKPIQVNDSENKTIEDALKKAIIDTYSIIKGNTEILKIKKYAQGYLVLVLRQGESGGIAIYYVEEKEGRNFIANGVAGGDVAMSMGFGVNRLVLGNDTIFFCNLNDSTWIPESDTRKETNYARIVFDFDDGNTIEEKVENDKGYILIYNGVVNVKDMKLCNADNELVNVYKDVGATKEVDYRLLNSQ